MQNSNLKAFTLVELIVVITILAILGTIAFISLQGYSNSAKNSVVISDIKLLNSDLELFYQKSGKYPEPDGPIVNVINGGGLSLFKQGFIGDGVMRNLGDINKKPLNPFTEEEYKYSKTTYGNEYELASYLYDSILSNNFINKTNALDKTNLNYYVKGNFNGIMVYNKATSYGNINIYSLPSLITNIENLSGTGINLYYNYVEQKLVVNGNKENESIEFKPGLIYSGEVPKEDSKIHEILVGLISTYSGTTSENLLQIKNLINEKDNEKFVYIGKNYINNKILGKQILYVLKTNRNCNYIGGLYEQEYKNGEWGECIRKYCYNGFEETGTGCTWTGTFYIDANDENTYINDNTLFKDNVFDNGGGKIFKNSNATWFYSTIKIPIDTSKTYNLSGKFKSTLGTGYVYFGLRTYDENLKPIFGQYVFRYGNDATIESISDEKIITNTTLTDWKGDGTYVYNRSLGFYYNGDTTKLADDLYLSPDNGYTIVTSTKDSTHGAYSITSGNEILLNFPIPKYITDKIIPGTTKVKNHSSGSTWNYSYLQNLNPTLGQINFSRAVTGEYYGYSQTQFRTGTKYAELFVGKTDGFELEFDEIKLEELP